MIHNAGLIMDFFARAERAERTLIARERLVDTLLLACQHPAGPNRVMTYARDINRQLAAYASALLDAEILAEVYVELTARVRRNLAWAEGGNRHRWS